MGKEYYNIYEMPLSNKPELKIAQEKVLRGEELTTKEKLILGRDNTYKEINGYMLRPDCVYRVVSPNVLEIYQQTGYVLGVDLEDEYLEYTQNGETFSNNRGVDWYLGAFCKRYGSIILECPADKEYFVPALDNGCGMSKDPMVRHMKSSGVKNPVPMSMITNIFDLRELNEKKSR